MKCLIVWNIVNHPTFKVIINIFYAKIKLERNYKLKVSIRYYDNTWFFPITTMPLSVTVNFFLSPSRSKPIS